MIASLHAAVDAGIASPPPADPGHPDLLRFLDACDLRLHTQGADRDSGSDPRSAEADPADLILRLRAIRAAEGGIAASARLLGNSDLVGAIGGIGAPVSNLFLRWGVGMRIVETMLGVDRRHRPAPFARAPFDRWLRKRERKFRKACSGGNGTAALFPGCRINYRHPDIGRSAVAVLLHNDVRPCLPEQRCCGRSQIECGDAEGGIQNIRFNAGSFRRHAEEGRAIVVLEEECARHVRSSPSWASDGEDATTLARTAVSLFEFLHRLHVQGRLKRDLHSSGERIALVSPAGCAENPGARGIAAILASIPKLQVVAVPGAPRFGWSLSSRTTFFAAMEEAALESAQAVKRSGAVRIVSECPATGRRLAAMTGIPAAHPVEILRGAYGLPLPR